MATFMEDYLWTANYGGQNDGKLWRTIMEDYYGRQNDGNFYGLK